MASRRLDDLSSQFKPKAMELLARLMERGVPVQIVCTLRSLEEQQGDVDRGVSQTIHSRHLSRTNRGLIGTSPDMSKADAMDLCPYAQWIEHGEKKLNWDANDPQFHIIGEEAHKLGLIWGGDWKTLIDPGHVELPLSVKGGSE